MPEGIGLVFGAIAAAIAAAAGGAVVRRRKRARAAAVDWVIEVRGLTLRVHGPWRDANGQIHAMSDRQQRAWAQSIGAREPTAEEYDEIWRTADYQVPPHLWPRASGPLTAMDDDARANGAKAGDRIAVGKTWLTDASNTTTNYGYFVPASQVRWNQADNHFHWVDRAGNSLARAWPSVTMPGQWFVLQAPGHAHNEDQIDNSQAGYAVEVIGTQPGWG